MKKILIIDDDTSLTYSLQRAFMNQYNIITANCAASGMKILESEADLGLVFLDYKLGEENGLNVLERIKKDFRNVPIVFMTAYGTSDTVLEAVKHGAVDFLVKPVAPNEFTEAIDTYHTLASDSCDKGFIKVPEYNPSHKLVGISRGIRDVLKLTASASMSDAPVLLTGESGTGKDLVASLLHEHSDRNNQPFLAINCAAIPQELLESELFGYVKGAFSGAVASKIGLLESANGGTVFLDEISEMPIELQAKMLRFLQNGTVQKLGELKEVNLDVRIIAATNKDIVSLSETGVFRHDLYYRLSVVNIFIPPLRERKEDIKDIALHLIAKHTRKHNKNITCVDKELFVRLEAYNWPGNVRELENRIREGIILAKNNHLSPDDFKAFHDHKEPPSEISLFDYFSDKYSDDIYSCSIDECEKILIKGALDMHQGKLAKAATWLNISRMTLNAKIKKYEIDT
ncbi:MAG: sigma-54-dependent Fis family transcriptional regulator [Denitrovibrio sp.]|nr:MAG: sigma-54-dependent Fis family transcriptional regulator [Denitrovibrio sp.]